MMTQDMATSVAPSFLAHSGDMGALINAQDWRETVLGAPESWPEYFKGVLATVLGSCRPMYVLWGPELLFFFNDAYRPILGAARVAGALGRPFAQVWSEVWEDMKPTVHSALEGNEFSCENMPLTLTRHGYAEATWWSFSYIPLRNEKAEIVGIHCITTETTDQIKALEQLAFEKKRHVFWAELGDELRDANYPRTLMAVAAEKLGQHLNASCVGYADVDASGQWAQVAQDWTAPGGISVVGTHRLVSYGPAMIAQLRAGRTVVVNDITIDPITCAVAGEDAYRSIGLRAFINAPLVKDSRLATIMFVFNHEARIWTNCDKALVEEVAERTWSELQRLQAELDIRDVKIALGQRTTELLRTETALRQSQKLEALGQLTGGVAHDFNNLLAVISSSVELLRSSRLPEENRAYYLDLIFDTVSRAAKVTSQLLAFARQQPLSPEVFNVIQHVQDVVDLVRPLMGEQIEILLEDFGDKCCLAEADISQFETAMVNLAVNARDAMDACGKLTVKVQAVDSVPAAPGRALRPGAFIAISVTDSGCGIAPDKLQIIFEPFYTTKEMGKGTGLGLSQVFGFAKQSGGEIEVRSELGIGSVFTLYLERAERVAAPQTLAALNLQGTNELRQGTKVLVVEDNDILAQMTCEILRTLGYRTAWASNATVALDILAKEGDPFDLVFSDVMMPGMTGIEFVQLVRKLYPGLPVVLTSGYSAVIAAQGRNGMELIQKPYTSDALLPVFRKVIEHRS